MTYLIPVLGSLAADRVRSLVPKLVALPRIISSRAGSTDAVAAPAPLSASGDSHRAARRGSRAGRRAAEAHHRFVRGVFRAAGDFHRRGVGGGDAEDGGDDAPPLLFMRTVIQAEAAAPTLKEFTLGLLRTLARRQVWKMDPKIWEGFMRCAKRATPRSFPVLCEMPAAAMREMLKSFRRSRNRSGRTPRRPRSARAPEGHQGRVGGVVWRRRGTREREWGGRTREDGTGEDASRRRGILVASLVASRGVPIDTDAIVSLAPRARAFYGGQ